MKTVKLLQIGDMQNGFIREAGDDGGIGGDEG